MTDFELVETVRAVARGCKGCLRRGGSCALCDRQRCRIIVERIDAEEAERRRAAAGRSGSGRPAGTPDITNAAAVRERGKSAYPDGMPCKLCADCLANGKCGRHKQKNRQCKAYTGWVGAERARIEKGM